MRVLTIIGIVLLGLVPLLLLYSAQSGPPERVWLRAPGWSRAQVVGTTRHEQQTPIAVDAAGNAYLFLVQGSATQRRPQIIALDPRAAQRWEASFDIQHRELRDPQLLWDGRELVLFWIGDAQLYTARIDPAGAVQQAPAVISEPIAVAGYSAATFAGVTVAWVAGAEETPGLYVVREASPGAAPQQIAPIGERPQLRSDVDGALHAIWLDRPAGSRVAALAYAPLRADGTLQAAPQMLTEVANVGRGAEVSGPWFGVDATHGYVGWHTRITSGMSAGQTFTLQTAFPLDQPTQVAEVQPLLVPERSTPAYTAPATVLNSGARWPFTGTAAGATSPPANIAANPTPAGELALACEGSVGVGSGQRVPQICMIYFAGGVPTGFQRLSLSERSAFAPALISDAAGNLYLSWRELRPDAAVVYFAGTAPETVAGLAAIGLDDLLRLASTIVFGMVAGVIFAPFAALLWIGPALALLIPHALMQRFGVRTGRWGAGLSLLLALGGFWAAKVLVLGPALASVPFASWLPLLTPGVALTLQIATPLLIAAGALYGAWAASYGRGVRSLLLFVLVYGAIDTLATMAVYGAGLFGQ
jgi:hypothetical protein